MKVAVFSPINIRKGNAFDTGEHPVFEYLQKKMGYEITYIIDGKDDNFDHIIVKHIKRSSLKTSILRVLRILLLKYKYYWKIPYYENLDFSTYDIVITEGIHYAILDYVKHIASKVILNDSISRNFTLSLRQVNYLNNYFGKSLAVAVNDKIPLLYKKNGLHIVTRVIGHAVDIEKIPFIKRTSCRGKLVSSGRLSEEKGFEYIIKALAILKNKYSDIKLDIYGEGLLKEELMRLIKSLHLEEVVFIKGFLPYHDLINVLGNYDLFISHPIETSYIAEAFSMANIEAMASGLAVITTDCGGVPSTVKDKAIIVEQKNINQVVGVVENFIKNPDAVEKYSQEGRIFVQENYSIKVIAEKWDKAIKGYYKA